MRRCHGQCMGHGAIFRLGSVKCARPEYKPPGNDHDPPTERRIQCLGVRLCVCVCECVYRMVAATDER